MAAMQVERVLIDAAAIGERIGALAGEISRDYAGKDLVLIAALKGAYVFMADLSRCLDVPHHIEFVRAASYHGGTESSGSVEVQTVGNLDIAGRHVLVVEDIYDTGLTVYQLREALLEQEPASLEMCVFLHKERARLREVDIRYRAFHVPDVFVVGYGLDFDQYYRNLPYVAVLSSTDGPPYP